jgi:hypothetical protein
MPTHFLHDLDPPMDIAQQVLLISAATFAGCIALHMYARAAELSRPVLAYMRRHKTPSYSMAKRLENMQRGSAVLAVKTMTCTVALPRILMDLHGAKLTPQLFETVQPKDRRIFWRSVRRTVYTINGRMLDVIDLRGIDSIGLAVHAMVIPDRFNTAQGMLATTLDGAPWDSAAIAKAL